MMIGNGKSLFVDATLGGEISHTGSVIADEIIKIMKYVGIDKVAGVCTDNAANNKYI